MGRSRARLTGMGLLALLAVTPAVAGAPEIEYLARDGATGGAWLRWGGGPAVLVPVGASIPGIGWVTEVEEAHVGLTVEPAPAPDGPGAGTASPGEVLLILVPREDLTQAAIPLD